MATGARSNGPGDDTVTRLGGQIERRAFRNQLRPTRTIAAAFEAESLQERRTHAAQVDRVDSANRFEIHFETARFVVRRIGGGNRENPSGNKNGRIRRGRNQQVWNLTTIAAEQAHIVQATFSNPALTEGADRKRLRPCQERHVDVEALRTGRRVDVSLLGEAGAAAALSIERSGAGHDRKDER
jgi:hypothetical protein